tara:strand:+ start:57 stop:554 length:498 start_codon:yes stop_codon:yes gene_type:complete
MIISCPRCKKRFNIDRNLIPLNGRNLKCGSCSEVWFYKLENKSSEPLIINKDNVSNEKQPNIVEKEIKESVKNKQSILVNKSKDKITKNKKILEKKSLNANKIKKSIEIKFFSHLIVFVISLVAIIILLDTLKTPLINIFPGLEIILFSLFETLQDIKLFIIDFL